MSAASLMHSENRPCVGFGESMRTGGRWGYPPRENRFVRFASRLPCELKGSPFGWRGGQRDAMQGGGTQTRARRHVYARTRSHSRNVSLTTTVSLG